MIQSNFVRSSAMTSATPSVGERVLVARLRGRQQAEIVQPFVANERLRQLGDAVDDVDQVEDDAPLGAEHEVQVPQADVEIDHHDLVAAPGQRRTERRRRSGFADAAFT